jgi:hypothetical protein
MINGMFKGESFNVLSYSRFAMVKLFNLYLT